MTVEIIAGWENPEEIIGTLSISKAHGKEIVSIEMNPLWMEEHRGIFLDPDVSAYRGKQYPPADKTLFGFLSDSCPDRWGRRLLDRAERIQADAEHRSIRKLSDSDYLLGVSDELRYGGIRFRDARTGEYLSASQEKVPPIADLRMLEEASRGYELSDDDTEALQILLSPGSSLGGARPKANVRDVDGSLWIAKFPSKNDEINVGAWEMVEHDLARLCGINVPDARIVTLSSHGATFLSHRFDRDNGKRIHLLSAMTALGMTDGNTDGVSYLDIAGFIEQTSAQPENDLQELWRRIAFNVLTSNCDDHLRNHGFILTPDGWQLSPAYDLNPTVGKDELSLNITDSDNRRTIPNVLSVAELFRIENKNAEEIIKKMQDTICENWRILAGQYGIHSREITEMSPAFALCEKK